MPTFIPPVAAKSYSELSGSLTPVHPHLLVHESPHLSSQGSGQGSGPRRRGSRQKGNNLYRHHHHHGARSLCQSPSQLSSDGRMRSTMTTFIPQPARAKHLSPHASGGATRTTQPPQGRLTVASPSSSRDTQPPPFTPYCFERTNFPVVKVLRGYPFRCEHSRGDSLFLGKQAQPYVLVRPSTRVTRPPLSTVPTYAKIGHQTASMGGK